MTYRFQSPAVFLIGPTASGKTDTAIKLAEKYPFEIISVDSAMAVSYTHLRAHETR